MSKPGVLGAWAAIVLVSLLIAAGVGWVIARERTAQVQDQALLNRVDDADPDFVANETRPIILPKVVPASDSPLRPDDLVIGVEAGGKARAYRLTAFRDHAGHLVNDVVGGEAVSVAYCNLTDCARVYREEGRNTPIDLQVAGRQGPSMILRSGSSWFFQKTGEPYEPKSSGPTPSLRADDAVRMTWEEWSRLHPETDVYAGDGRAATSIDDQWPLSPPIKR